MNSLRSKMSLYLKKIMVRPTRGFDRHLAIPFSIPEPNLLSKVNNTKRMDSLSRSSVEAMI